MCDEDEPTFTMDVPLNVLPPELQMNYARTQVVAAAREALTLLETGNPGLAERTLRLALHGGNPKLR